MHDYPNLYYSCTSCNNKKDAVILSLNPCSDDIFGGEHPHVLGGTPETEFVLEGASPEGNAYIMALELNSRHHILLRKSQYAWLQAKSEASKILQDLCEKGKLDVTDIQQIYAVINYSAETDRFKSTCGGSKYAVDFSDACR